MLHTKPLNRSALPALGRLLSRARAGGLASDLCVGFGFGFDLVLICSILLCSILF